MKYDNCDKRYHWYYTFIHDFMRLICHMNIIWASLHADVYYFLCFSWKRGSKGKETGNICMWPTFGLYSCVAIYNYNNNDLLQKFISH